MCIERRRFSQTMASEWQTAFVVSHKMPWYALLTAAKNYKKVLKNCKTFSSRPRPRPRPNVQDQDQDFMIQDFHFCPRGASRPRPLSRGLHHWLGAMYATDVSQTDVRQKHRLMPPPIRGGSIISVIHQPCNLKCAA